VTAFEVCIDSIEGALAAEAAGADRVELCSALFDGGLTPSIGTIESTMRLVQRIKVHVIVRPRGGDFIYSPVEIDSMVRDVEAAVAAGADGVVFGALTAEGGIDLATTARLVTAAGSASTTFHRAFDMVKEPFLALEQLIGLGIDRILTSGQESTVLEGAPLIAELVRKAGSRITIMPGSGITARNIARIVELTGAHEFHFAALQSTDGPAAYRNPRPSMGGALRAPEYARSATSPELVRSIIAATPQG
jgi:copper homeostasis protein